MYFFKFSLIVVINILLKIKTTIIYNNFNIVKYFRTKQILKDILRDEFKNDILLLFANT